MIPRRATSGFLRDAAGVSAVEFALILPVMLALLVGGVEFSRAVDNSRKVTLLARTLADLTSQGDTVNPMQSATMQDILQSASLVLAPYDSSNAGIVISAMGVYANNLVRPYVCSSVGQNATARSVKSASDLTIPAPFQTPGMRYLLAEVTMPYQPTLGAATLKFFTGSSSFTFAVGLPWPVRGGSAINSTNSEIVLPNGKACPLLGL